MRKATGEEQNKKLFQFNHTQKREKKIEKLQKRKMEKKT